MLDRIKDGRTDLAFDYLSEGHPANSRERHGVALVPPLRILRQCRPLSELRMLRMTKSLLMTLLTLSLAQISVVCKRSPGNTNVNSSSSQKIGRTVTLKQQGISLTIPIGWHKDSESIETDHSSFVWRGPNNGRLAVNVSIYKSEWGNRAIDDETNTFYHEHKGDEDLRLLEIDGVRGVHFRRDWDTFDERYQPELDKLIKWAGQCMCSGKREVIFVDLSCPAKTFTKDKDTLYSILQSIRLNQDNRETSASGVTPAETVDEAPVIVSVFSDHEFYVRKRLVERAQVATEVDNLIWNLPEEKRIVYLKPMPDVAYGLIVGIIDDLRVLGYDRIGLVADKANGRPEIGVDSRRPTEPGKQAGQNSAVQGTGAEDLLVVTIEVDTGGLITARVGDVHVPLRELASKVRPLLKDRNNRNAKIVAPHTMHYGSVVKVIEAVKAGGAEAIAFGDYVQSP